MKKRNQFNLPKINEKATRKEVERSLEEYRKFMLTLPGDFLPSITQSFSLVPPSHMNKFNSTTENAAIERVEFEITRNKFMSKIHEAVNSLKEDERFIIIKRFMLEEIGYDPDIWMELGVGKTKYYQIKGEAMLRLAFTLKIEVYRKSEVKSA